VGRGELLDSHKHFLTLALGVTSTQRQYYSFRTFPNLSQEAMFNPIANQRL